ncbi:MAG TPA: type II secretion system minor pseudopilin GspK [Gammaproteobacteria bacterium]|nr:type II secretion system minor pseudopilin GspK [Gammaproteobacteria bacterium]
MMQFPASQRGVALITALVVLAIAATISAAMIWQGGLDERRTATLIQGNQAMEYALGAESWAEQILQRDFKQNSQSVNLGQDWAQQLPPLPVEGGQIIGHIEDMQGRFNLDLLSGPSPAIYQAQFVRILEALNLDPTIAPALTDWFSNNPVANPNGAKDDFYSRLQPPYLTGQTPMTSVSELQLVKGVTPQAYAALLPYVCAIPVTTATASSTGTSTSSGGWALNINTASPLLLMSLAPNVSQDQVAQVVAARAANGISQADFNNIIKITSPSGQGPAAGSPIPGVTSSYFLLTVTAEIGSTHVTMYSLLRYTGGQATAIRRTFGTL